jgi:hypothetical protein
VVDEVAAAVHASLGGEGEPTVKKSLTVATRCWVKAINPMKNWPERYNVPWAWHNDYAPEAALKSMSGIKEILEEGDRLAIAFWMHDGIFHAPLTDLEVCAKIRAACQKNEMLSFTFDAKLRILSVP